MALETEQNFKKCCYLQPERRKNMKPNRKYRRPMEPFSDETVHRTSYLPIDPKTLKECQAESTRPTHNINLNSHLKMDTDTVQNLSYQPVVTRARQTPPWAVKKKFKQPVIPMDLSTIYENSYQLPGRFVECDENAPANAIVTYAVDCGDIEGLVRIPDGGYIY